jgi:site-specific recombinase XerD
MRVDEFLNERKYLLNVSHKTLVYYGCAFKAWEKHKGDEKPVTWIKNMLESGIKPVSVNTYICAMNCYWKWEGAGIKLKYIKEEEKILATLTPDQLTNLVHCKFGSIRKQTNLQRAHLVALTICDTGLRASEVLSLTISDVDCDNLTIKVKGKGGKHRLVPFSTELRKFLFRLLMQRKNMFVAPAYLFGTKHNTAVTVRNLERDFQILGQRLNITGVRFSPHTLRHTFAVNWLCLAELHTSKPCTWYRHGLRGPVNNPHSRCRYLALIIIRGI